MKSITEDDLRQRINKFESSFPARKDDTPISIQIRVDSGCFHREHSPFAYREIDLYIYNHLNDNFTFEEHENGPEFLVFLSWITDGIHLSQSVIDFVAVITKARTDGTRHGDHRSEPIELVIRGFNEHGEYIEIKVLRILPRQTVSRYLIEKALLSSANKMVQKTKVTRKRLSTRETYNDRT
jgi:hypothetical protein